MEIASNKRGGTARALRFQRFVGIELGGSEGAESAFVLPLIERNPARRRTAFLEAKPVPVLQRQTRGVCAEIAL